MEVEADRARDREDGQRQPDLGVVPREANALGDRRSSTRARVALDLEELVLAHQRERGQHGEEGDRVDEEADAGAAEADDHAGDRGADDPRAVEEAGVHAIAFGSSSRPTIWNVNAWRPGASSTSALPPRNART